MASTPQLPNPSSAAPTSQSHRRGRCSSCRLHICILLPYPGHLLPYACIGGKSHARKITLLQPPPTIITSVTQCHRFIAITPSVLRCRFIHDTHPPPSPRPSPQFLFHFLGYLALEVSQTILIWLISTPGLWNGAERASQEYVGLSLAIIMVRETDKAGAGRWRLGA